MGRIDWLRDVDAGFGQAVLAIALEIWVNLEGKRRMVRIDWMKEALEGFRVDNNEKRETGTHSQKERVSASIISKFSHK